jgi:tRNA U38,U39,U40 pseudouridine synthase TruA
MVRFLVGALVAIGSDKLELKEFETMVTTASRNCQKFQCAPSHALTLQKVDYVIPIEWVTAEK